MSSVSDDVCLPAQEILSSQDFPSSFPQATARLEALVSKRPFWKVGHKLLQAALGLNLSCLSKQYYFCLATLMGTEASQKQSLGRCMNESPTCQRRKLSVVPYGKELCPFIPNNFTLLFLPVDLKAINIKRHLYDYRVLIPE